MMWYNNQPKLVFAVFMMIDQRGGGGGAYGGAPWHHVGHWTSDQKTNNKKYGVTLDVHRLTIINAATKKQVLMMEKGKERRFDQGGARWERYSIVLGVIELGYCKNLK